MVTINKKTLDDTVELFLTLDCIQMNGKETSKEFERLMIHYDTLTQEYTSSALLSPEQSNKLLTYALASEVCKNVYENSLKHNLDLEYNSLRNINY